MVINYLYLLPLLRLTGQVLAVPMFGCLLSYAHAHYFQPFCCVYIEIFSGDSFQFSHKPTV